MPFRASVFLAAMLATTLNLAPANAEDRPPLADRIIENQLKAFNDILAPDLQQALTQYQQHWVAYRDEQCRFELASRAAKARRRCARMPAVMSAASTA